jgi:hypothetical protein
VGSRNLLGVLINEYVQADLLEGVLLILIKLVSRRGIGRINSPELEMPHYRNTIKTPIRLSLKRLHKAVQVNSKVIPTALFPVGIGALDKERFNLELVVGRGDHDASFGLCVIRQGTLLRSEMTSSMLHCNPCGKWIWKTRYCWIKYRSFFSYFGNTILPLGVVN